MGVSTVDDDTEWRAEIARTLVDAPVVPGARLAVRDVEAAQAEALLAIGPLENVARLLAAGALPPRVCVMGGVVKPVHHRGAVRDVEHNFASEPAAARAVIGRTPGLLLCPLDVTVRMRPSTADLEALVGAARDRAVDDLQEADGHLDARVGAALEQHLRAHRAGIVHVGNVVPEPHAEADKQAGDDADGSRRPRGHEGTPGGDGHQAGKHPVAAHGDVGLAVLGVGQGGPPQGAHPAGRRRRVRPTSRVVAERNLSL